MIGITVIWILYCILSFEDEPFYLISLILTIIVAIILKCTVLKEKLTDKEKAQMIRNWEEYKRNKNENK